MQQRRTGSIVNVASEAGRVGSQGSVIYSAAKAGLSATTRPSPASPRATGCAATRLRPGPIETPLLNAAPQMLGEIGERLKQGMVNATALTGRSGEPDEVAAAITFLASDDASYVTGQTLNVERWPFPVASLPQARQHQGGRAARRLSERARGHPDRAERSS